MESSKTIDTPIATTTHLDMDEPGFPVNETMYKGIIATVTPHVFVRGSTP